MIFLNLYSSLKFVSAFLCLPYHFAEMPISIAIIVCEGDIETISHISQALTNKIPVIIMKGSGKAADLVSDYLQT